MNPDYEQQLEADIDRELKGLPELQAPGTLTSRVLAAFEQRKNVPWYHQAWHNWPPAMRVSALVALTALFSALCFAGWKLPRTEGFSIATQHFAVWFSTATGLWNALNSFFAAVLLLVKHMGTGVLIGCLAAMALAWAMCLGLGTFCVRLALMRR